MNEKEQEIADKIRKAFAGVKLGQGIGLMQGDGLDDYADGEKLQELRFQDEADDWTQIDSTTLDAYSASLSYMGEAGMRFHLPAYVLADLQGWLLQADILFHLCSTSNQAATRFDLLNAEQREAIREFLYLRLADPNYSFQHPMIETAIKNYWDND